MLKKYTKFVVVALIIASIILSGCGVQITIGKKATATPQPPTESPATQTPYVIVVTPTEDLSAARPTPETSAQSATSIYKLASSPYNNLNGGFILYPPEGWTLMGEGSNFVSYFSPDNITSIVVRYNNTGYELDSDGFSNYVIGNEANRYAIFDGYTETSNQINAEDRNGAVYKTFTYDKQAQMVETLYDQFGDVVYEIELWSSMEQWDSLIDFFNEFLVAVDYYPDQVAYGLPYLLVDTYYGKDNAFSYEYYQPWNPTWDWSDPYFKLDTFTSPDGYAFIEDMYYNDNSTEFGKANAGAWALDNLETYYARNANDLKVDKDQINSKGYEYLEWHTKQDKWVGITIFYAEGTQVELLTVAWQASYADVYEEALRYVIDTFTAPAE